MLSFQALFNVQRSLRCKSKAAGTASMRFGGSATAKVEVEQLLDAQRLTVLGRLLTLGLYVGLSVGFGIGGWQGVVVGVVVGVGLAFALARAFRRSRTRLGLVKLADWAIGRR